jgi:hypothetical protein
MGYVYAIGFIASCAGSFYAGARYGRRMEKAAVDGLVVGYMAAKMRYENLVKAWTTKA